MSPVVLAQICTSMGSIVGPDAVKIVPALAKLPPHVMDGRDGQDRLRRLAFNCRYLSGGLRKLGFIVYGHQDSPIVPMLIFAPAKMGLFSRLMLERYKIVVVVVAYPATPLVSSRVRFCLSAAQCVSSNRLPPALSCPLERPKSTDFLFSPPPPPPAAPRRTSTGSCARRTRSAASSA